MCKSDTYCDDEAFREFDDIPGDAQDGEEEGYSVWGVAISIVSTIIGGGIVSVPYAMTAPGVGNGIMINLAIMVIMLIATHFYLVAKDILGYESISELSYVCFGRSSVFIINILVAFVIFGILTLYMILFAKISESLIDQFKE